MACRISENSFFISLVLNSSTLEDTNWRTFWVFVIVFFIKTHKKGFYYGTFIYIVWYLPPFIPHLILPCRFFPHTNPHLSSCLVHLSLSSSPSLETSFSPFMVSFLASQPWPTHAHLLLHQFTKKRHLSCCSISVFLSLHWASMKTLPSNSLVL